MTNLGSWWIPVIRDFVELVDGTGQMRCPGCGARIICEKPGTIILKLKTKRKYIVPEMWMPTEKCSNLNCNWGRPND